MTDNLSGSSFEAVAASPPRGGLAIILKSHGWPKDGRPALGTTLDDDLVDHPTHKRSALGGGDLIPAGNRQKD
jgi:hypothetical protein